MDIFSKTDAFAKVFVRKRNQRKSRVIFNSLHPRRAATGSRPLQKQLSEFYFWAKCRCLACRAPLVTHLQVFGGCLRASCQCRRRATGLQRLAGGRASEGPAARPNPDPHENLGCAQVGRGLHDPGARAGGGAAHGRALPPQLGRAGRRDRPRPGAPARPAVRAARLTRAVRRRVGARRTALCLQPDLCGCDRLGPYPFDASSVATRT